jgi:hypothetical protein
MVLSGCLGSVDGAEPSGTMGGDGHDHEHGSMEASPRALEMGAVAGDGSLYYPMQDFEVEMSNCREGGGVSLYESQKGDTGPTDPLLREDIAELLGDPKIGSYYRPITEGRATGIWHISTICESYSVNGDDRGAFEGGWVGVRVEPPPWDDSGIEHQFFLPDISFKDGQIVQDLQDGLLMHTSRMVDGRLDWVGPAAIHQVMDDEDHGVFQSHVTMREYGTMEVERMRMWVYADLTGNFNHGHDHAAEGAESPGHVPHGFQPVAIDFINTGQADQWVHVDGGGFLSHTRTDHHGETGGAAGNVGGIAWEGFDRTIRVGPSANLVYNNTWLH